MMQPSISRDVINRIRAASIKIFKSEKQQEVSSARPQRSLSFVRPRTISVLNKGSVQQIRRQSFVRGRSQTLVPKRNSMLKK